MEIDMSANAGDTSEMLNAFMKDKTNEIDVDENNSSTVQIPSEDADFPIMHTLVGSLNEGDRDSVDVHSPSVHDANEFYERLLA